jgi:hypothetical protein
MEHEITDADRTAMVRCAVSRAGRDDVKGALARANDPSFQAPTSVINALKALRKHRDPTSVVTRPQYRAALPYLAVLVSEACLSRTIEALGDHSDHPTRDQLLAALEEVREVFPDSTIGVMLASVADAEMPASDLCFGLAATDVRFGLSDWADSGTATTSGPGPSVGGVGGPGLTDGADGADPTGGGTTQGQREARRLKKQKDAEERRRKMEAARTAGEQVRKEPAGPTPRARESPGRATPDPEPTAGEGVWHRGSTGGPPSRRSKRRSSTRPIPGSVRWYSPGSRSTPSTRTSPTSTASRDVAWSWPARPQICWCAPATPKGG